MEYDYKSLSIEVKKKLLNNMPAELKQHSNWCIFKLELDKQTNKIKKIPINPKSLKGADSTNPQCWSNFNIAYNRFSAGKADGIGFMFSNSPYVGVDIDHCINENGIMSKEAQEIVNRLNSYTEYSPSGTGIHIICKVQEGFNIEGNKNTSKGIEIYTHSRYFTMTGNTLGINTDIRECTEDLLKVHNDFIPKKKKSQNKKDTVKDRTQRTVELSDQELLNKAFASKNGAEIKALYCGNYNTLKYKSQSEADMALCNYLAFWTNKNPEQMDRIFRSSSLYRPKWDSKRGASTLGLLTINEAINSCVEGYDPVRYKAIKDFEDLIGDDETPQNNSPFMRHSNGKIILDDISLEDIAKYLVEKYNIKLIDDTLHFYDNGLYKPIIGGIFDSIALKELHNSKSNYRKELLPYVRVGATETKPSPSNLILFKNGVLDINTMELNSISEKYIFLNRIPHNYNSNPIVNKMLDNFLSSFVCGDDEAITLLWQVIGYCLYRGNPLQEFILIQGEGGNGKSTFLQFLAYIIGEDNTSYLSLDDLTNKYMLSDIKNKLLNIGDDINSTYKEQEDTLKKIVSGETIRADMKYKDPVSIKYYGKTIFSANSIPRFNDKSNGLKRRMNILPFLNDFTKNGERDFNILYKLRNEDIAEYCIYKAIQHLKDLLTTGAFTKPASVISANEEYAKRNNPIIEFLEDFKNGDIKSDFDTSTGTDITAIPAQKVFETYKNWCFITNYKPLGRNEFYRLVKNEGFELIRKRTPQGLIKAFRLTEQLPQWW